MKVITEERLLEKFAALYWGTDNCDQLLEKLLAECKEIGTLEVSKLRPMSEAPRNGKFLVVLNTEDDFHECSFLEDGRVKVGTVALRAEYCIGWIPKPIYKPEEMICPDACG